MGGEKLAFPAILARELGSPPRGRGKAPGHPVLRISARITPAWAGKSLIQAIYAYLRRDHPRVGGEKAGTARQRLQQRGSPPRGRGKVVYLSVSIFSLRITPAWAGKSFSITARGRVRRDHPRVGGEKPRKVFSSFAMIGSPPRGRGKALFFIIGVVIFGITPAWAGKSTARMPRPRNLWDHPRVGGEKRFTDRRVVCSLGSPPRGRGKVVLHCGVLFDVGITPAWAGKSRSKKLRLALNEDHPRVGGEKRYLYN